MLVEFIGPAGVGKSFQAARLCEALRVRGQLVHEFDLIPIGRLNLRNMCDMLTTTVLAQSTKPQTLAIYMHNLRVIGQYRIRRKLCKNIAGIHVTSDGLFHKLILMSRRSKGLRVDQLAAHLFQTIVPPDVVVVVESDAATIHERRTLRNRPHDVFTIESVRADIAMVEESIGVILAVQQRFKKDLRLVRIKAANSGHDLVTNEIAELIQNTDPRRPMIA